MVLALRLLAVALQAGFLATASPSSAEEPRRAARPAASLACPDMPRRDRIDRVEPSGDIIVASGGRARLVDIRLATSEDGLPGARPDARAWLASLAGAEIEIRDAGPADRWGRVPVRLAVREGGTAIDAAELLVAEGLAVVDAGERDALCRNDLLDLERRARAGRLGIWAAGRWPIAATDLDALRAGEGRFAVVEGRIVSVGERRGLTYLNFGRDFARDLAIVVPKRAWTAMKAAGLGASELRGRIVTVRGLIEVRRGPTMELVAPDMLMRGGEGRSGLEAGRVRGGSE